MLKFALIATIQKSFPQALVSFRNLDRSIKLIHDMGYDGVEIALYGAETLDRARIKNLIAEYDMAIPVLSTGQVFTMEKVWFTHPESNKRRRAVDIFKGIIDLAAEFGSDVNISRTRGYLDQDDSYESGIAKLTECLYELCEHAGTLGVNLLLEQMNRFETNYFHKISEISEYIRTTGIPNLKAHPDTFHMNIEEKDQFSPLVRNSDVIGYIHFSDNNRLIPGYGHIDFRTILTALKLIEYDGWIGIEFVPKSDVSREAEMALAYIKTLLELGI